MPHTPLALIRGELGRAHEKFNLNRCQLLSIVFLLRKAESIPQSPKFCHATRDLSTCPSSEFLYANIFYYELASKSHNVLTPKAQKE